jgi:hypothetical protein
MTKDLDDRIADFEAKRREKGRVATLDAGHVARTVADLEEAVRQASFSVGGLNARTDEIQERAAKLETRVCRLGFVAVGGVIAACVGALIILATAFWLGAQIKSAAKNEAARLRAAYAIEIATVRQEGEATLDQLYIDLAHRSEAAGQQLTEIGTELAALSEERDAVLLELERFIQLRERVGIQLVEFRGRTVVVVPEGARLRRWRATEELEVAHLNGRMYRLSD